MLAGLNSAAQDARHQVKGVRKFAEVLVRRTLRLTLAIMSGTDPRPTESQAHHRSRELSGAGVQSLNPQAKASGGRNWSLSEATRACSSKISSAGAAFARREHGRVRFGVRLVSSFREVQAASLPYNGAWAAAASASGPNS